jgi:hypothetical protein
MPKKPEAPEPRLFTVKEAAAYLSCSRSTFDKHWAPKLRSFKVGARRMYDRRHMDELLDGRRQTGKLDEVAAGPDAVDLDLAARFELMGLKADASKAQRSARKAARELELTRAVPLRTEGRKALQNVKRELRKLEAELARYETEAEKLVQRARAFIVAHWGGREARWFVREHYRRIYGRDEAEMRIEKCLIQPLA